MLLLIRQFLASQDLIMDMIFEWLEFLVEVQTGKKPKKYHKKPKKPKKKPNATANFKFGTGFFGFFRVFSVFLGCNPPPTIDFIIIIVGQQKIVNLKYFNEKSLIFNFDF